MKFQYIGNGKEDPVKTVCYGLEFVLNGDEVEVTDKEILKKIHGNPTFRVVDEKDDELEALKKEATEKGIKFHHKIGVVKLRELIELNGD